MFDLSEIGPEEYRRECGKIEKIMEEELPLREGLGLLWDDLIEYLGEVFGTGDSGERVWKEDPYCKRCGTDLDEALDAEEVGVSAWLCDHCEGEP